MISLGKWSTAVTLGLVLSLTLCVTGVFAQGASQQIEHGNISISAHRAVENNALQFATRGTLDHAVQRPDGTRGNCGGWDTCSYPQPILRCSSQRECRTVQECRWTGGVRICRGYKVCRFRSICRRCFNHAWGPWVAKQH